MPASPTSVIGLAAGLGPRMLPFDGSLPKPLVQVGGKALLDYVLDRVAAQKVDRAVVNVHYLADQIEQHLASTGRGERRYAGLRPKDAATLIILDRDGPLPRVLMGRRHLGHKFMPGKFVFPGGRIDLGDRSMPVVGALHPRIEAALAARVVRPSAKRGRALALAAIRENRERARSIGLNVKAYELAVKSGDREQAPPDAPADASLLGDTADPAAYDGYRPLAAHDA